MLKKLLLSFFLISSSIAPTYAVDTHGTLLKFWKTVDWDHFWGSFEFDWMGCDCYPKFFVTWCGVFFCDFLPAIEEEHWEPFAVFSASKKPLDFVSLKNKAGDGNGTHILGPKKGAGRKQRSPQQAAGERPDTDTASFVQTNMLPFPIASIVGFFDVSYTICLSTDAVDSTYISDIDPLYHNDGLNNFWTIIKSPTRLLDLLLPIWEWRCLIDCAANTINVPINMMYTCNGCMGSLGSQDTGWQKNDDPMANTEMLAYRTIHNFHERLKFMDISSDSCKSIPRLTIKKNQYKISLGAEKSNSPHFFGKLRFTTYDGKDSPTKAQDEYSMLLWKHRKWCGFLERFVCIN